MKLQITGIAIVLAASASAASAGFLGLPIHASYELREGTFASASGADAIVGPDVEFVTFPEDPPTFDVDLDDATIHITNFSSTDTFTAFEFNGVVFSDERNAVASFDGIHVIETTTMAGLDDSRLSFDDDHLNVDWGGLSFAPGTIVDLRVTFTDDATPPQTIPSPAAVPAGAAAILLIRRGRRRTPA